MKHDTGSEKVFLWKIRGFKRKEKEKQQKIKEERMCVWY